ncbi:MAG: archaeal heat shock protein Hsp20 [Thermoproteota archaeon]
MSFFRRRRWWIDEFFEDLEEMLRDMERMMERFFEDVERSRIYMRPGETSVRGPIVYGFRITIGPDGKPIVEEFGNVKRVGRRTIVEEEMEPLVDVIDEKDRVVVVAEMPGVDKDKIDLTIRDRKLIIKARGRDRSYYKEVDLPAKVKAETAKAKYNNGVLEVTVEKEKPETKEEGIKVKVE